MKSHHQSHVEDYNDFYPEWSDLRSADTEAWDALNNEQRNNIIKWYRNVRKRHRDEKKKIESLHIEASLFALSPFIFAYAIQRSTTFIMLLANLISALIVYSMIFYVFSEVYIGLIDRGENKIFKAMNIIAGVIVSFVLTVSVLSKFNLLPL